MFLERDVRFGDVDRFAATGSAQDWNLERLERVELRCELQGLSSGLNVELHFFRSFMSSVIRVLRICFTLGPNRAKWTSGPTHLRYSLP